MKTQKVRPVLIESKEKPEQLLWLNSETNKLWFDNHGKVSYKFKPKELILISLEDEIEIGDTGYIIIGGGGGGEGETIGYISYDKEYNTWNLTTDCEINYPFSDKNYIKKVIATQDKLGSGLIQKLVEEHNNGGMKDFEIEVEKHIDQHPDWKPTYSNPDDPPTISFWLPKLTNGFITIKNEPRIFTEDQVIELLKKCNMTFGFATSNELHEWFDQNKNKP